MRGLRVIIAGAGLSAALPGVVAAHTDLPVIGVPLTSSTSVAGGLDALLSIAQMPPGVPVACVGVDNARNAAVLAARILERVIARYTRPEIGAVWTDEARFGAMRDVEVAAAEALDGPTAEDLDAIRAATFTVDAINEREKILDHDTAAFVDVLAASAGPAGRWIHYGLTSSDVVDTGLALQLQRAGALLVPAHAHARLASWREKAREHADTLCVGRTHGVHAEPTSFGLKLAGYAMEAHRNAERLERAFDQITAAISGAVGTFATLGPDYEARVLAKLGPDAEPVSTQVVPRDRHAELLERDRAGRRRAGALRDRDPPPAADRGARGRGAVPQGPEGLQRDAAQAQPGRLRAHLRPRAGPARQRPGRRSRTSRSGTSATSRTPPPSGSSCPTRRSCSTRCWR